MPRNLPGHYTPHALLLASAMMGLSLTMSTAPQQPAAHRATVVKHSPAPQEVTVAQAPEYFERSYMYAEADVRGLGEVLSQARDRFEKMRQNRPEQDEQAERAEQDGAEAIAISTSPTEQRRMVRRQDVSWVAPAAPKFSKPYAGFVTGGGEGTPDTPDALPTREYSVLGFGDMGGEEPDERIVERDTARSGFVASQSSRGDTIAFNTSKPFTNAPASGIDGPVAEGGFDAASAIVNGPQPTAQEPTAFTRTGETVHPVSASASAVSVRQNETVTDRSMQEARQALSVVANTSALTADTRSLSTTAVVETDREKLVKNADTNKRADLVSKSILHGDRVVAPEPSAQVATAQLKTTAPQATSTQSQPTVQAPTNQHKNVGQAVKQQDKKDGRESLVVLVDGADTIGSDRVNAIDKALQEINQATKQTGIGVELTLTTDPGVGHNILLREDNNQALNGKLGLAESASVYDDHGNEYRLGQENSALGGQAVASINNAINWFTGDNAFEIKRDQYDYQTAVTHELLHLLGLDDDFGNDQSLVMHGYLSPGETRRAIEKAEKAELASRYAYTNLWGYSARSNRGSSRSVGYHRRGLTYRSEALTAAPSPEPGSALVMGAGVLAAGLRQRRFR